MRNKNDKIIYVGKAVVLKNRLRQYFQPSAAHTSKVRAMVENVTRFEYIVTDSEYEAFILECNLIKKYRPKYNVLLKDDKTYPYIKITLNEEYPRILTTRRILKDGARYFGPYSSAAAVKETINLIKKIFPLRTCNRNLPKDIGKERPCLNYYIKRCVGPCTGNVNKDEYRAMINDIIMFINGNQDFLIKRFTRQMKEAAENMEYEKAAMLRDRINSLKHVTEKQKVLSISETDQDAIACSREGPDICMQVFLVRSGRLIGKEHFMLVATEDTDMTELFTSFVKQYYNNREYIPKEILLQHEVEERDFLERWLTDKKGSRVYIHVPKRGHKLKLIEMVQKNSQIELQRYCDKRRTEGAIANEGLEGMMELLGLDKKPVRIEAYDISNTGHLDMVGSMVVFTDGKSSKNDYRMFRIKVTATQNDYAAMQEMVFRRFKRLSDAEFGDEPDLILVDGGKGHVNSVIEVLNQLNISIPVYGMVKDEHHNTRAIVSSNREYNISQNPEVLRLVITIQEEAHRFALQYNKKLRSKRHSYSVLDEISGVGERRKNALLRHFGSIRNIKNATVEELMEVKEINRKVAENIKSYFTGR